MSFRGVDDHRRALHPRQVYQSIRQVAAVPASALLQVEPLVEPRQVRLQAGLRQVALQAGLRQVALRVGRLRPLALLLLALLLVLALLPPPLAPILVLELELELELVLLVLAAAQEKAEVGPLVDLGSVLAERA